MATATLPSSVEMASTEPVSIEESAGDIVFHVSMAVCTLAVIVFSICGAIFGKLSISLSQATPLLGMMFLLLVVAAQYAWRRERKCFNIVMMAFWIVVITNMHFFPMYMAAGTDVPMSDHVLAAFDRAIGLEVPTVLAALAPYPSLNRFMLWIYGSMIPLMTLATLLPPIYDRMERARHYAIACVVAATIAMPIFACFQAIGPWEYYGFDPSIPTLAEKDEIMATLKTDALYVIDVTNRDGLIEFPSFHTILTVLAATALWPFRRLRWVTTPWAVLIVISTVTTGIHFLADVVGGLGVTWIAWRTAGHYLDAMQRKVSHRLHGHTLAG